MEMTHTDEKEVTEAPLENAIMPQVKSTVIKKRDYKISMDYWPEVAEDGKHKLSESTEPVSMSWKKPFNINNINE